MYSDFTFIGFRGFRHLDLKGLTRVNIFTGVNDAGKTSVLEAIFLHASGPLAGALSAQALRAIRQDPLSLGVGSENAWLSLFNNFDISKPIELTAKSSKETYRLRIEEDKSGTSNIVPVDSRFKANQTDHSNSISLVERRGTGPEKKYRQSIDVRSTGINGQQQNVSVEFRIDPPTKEPYAKAVFVKGQSGVDLATEYSNYRRNPNGVDLVAALQEIDERIERLEVLVSGGRPQLHAAMMGRLIPFPLLGDGLNAMAQYLLAMSSIRGGSLLLDEVGAGIHHDALGPMWRNIDSAANKLKVQIFATTHSEECVIAAQQAIPKFKDDLTIYRLERGKGAEDTIAVSYSGSTLEAAIKLNSELR